MLTLSFIIFCFVLIKYIIIQVVCFTLRIVIFINFFIFYSETGQLWLIKFKKKKKYICYKFDKWIKLVWKFIKNEQTIYLQYIELEFNNHLTINNDSTLYMLPSKKNYNLKNLSSLSKLNSQRAIKERILWRKTIKRYSGVCVLMI